MTRRGADQATLAETLWSGQLEPRDTIFDNTADFYPVIDRAVTKYPYDPRASERLMMEAGYTRGPDGSWASPTEGRLTLIFQAPNIRPELPIIAASWRQAGFAMDERARAAAGANGEDPQ